MEHGAGERPRPVAGPRGAGASGGPRDPQQQRPRRFRHDVPTVIGSRDAKNASWAWRSAPRSRQAEASGARGGALAVDDVTVPLEGADHRTDGRRAAPFGEGQAAAPAFSWL
ncbi:hypothetical protein QF030_002792 [Streptomyces rishiriensis]|uniref:Uncharacterized protein n=1 Tax=Streptomyces rishiriensis TaxID=68264 RepID=A0ABU0NNF0_STRRH|nr:hypothetical protein [Streptomyces rishiriensis]